MLLPATAIAALLLIRVESEEGRCNVEQAGMVKPAAYYDLVLFINARPSDAHILVQTHTQDKAEENPRSGHCQLLVCTLLARSMVHLMQRRSFGCCCCPWPSAES